MDFLPEAQARLARADLNAAREPLFLTISVNGWV